MCMRLQLPYLVFWASLAKITVLIFVSHEFHFIDYTARVSAIQGAVMKTENHCSQDAEFSAICLCFVQRNCVITR
jgi:hypothetical protein